MEYRIKSIKKEHVFGRTSDGDFVVAEFTGDAGHFTATAQVPYIWARQIPFNSTLLVTFAKPGFMGWLKRKLLA